MNNNIKPVFIFSKIERTGLYVVLFLILLTVGFKIYLPQWLSTAQEFSYNEELAHFEQQIAQLKHSHPKTPEQQSRTSISGQDSTRHHPVKIPADTPNKHQTSSTFSLTININTADTSQWKKLYGIGKVLSKRIVSFREKLGGFHSIEQLQEVYGLKPETFESIRPHLLLDSNYEIKKIDLNNSPVKEIVAHPYIDWDLANLIVAYRKQHNGFKTVYELRRTDLVNEKLYRKLAPYLTVKKYVIHEN